MRIAEYVNISLEEIEDIEPIDYVTLKQNGLDIMLENYGFKINGTEIVVVPGALITPNSQYEGDFDYDADITAILDCSTVTPDILYWETSGVEASLHNFLNILGCDTTYQDIEKIEVTPQYGLFEEALFESVFAA